MRRMSPKEDCLERVVRRLAYQPQAVATVISERKHTIGIWIRGFVSSSLRLQLHTG